MRLSVRIKFFVSCISLGFLTFNFLQPIRLPSFGPLKKLEGGLRVESAIMREVDAYTLIGFKALSPAECQKLSQAEIKKRFVESEKEFFSGGVVAGVLKVFEPKYRQQAYAVLSDRHKRLAYDLARHLGFEPFKNRLYLCVGFSLFMMAIAAGGGYKLLTILLAQDLAGKKSGHAEVPVDGVAKTRGAHAKEFYTSLVILAVPMIVLGAAAGALKLWIDKNFPYYFSLD
jgi:hypothetical protein